MSTLIQDLRYSLRALARAPGISAILLLSVGLGTGANAVVFSLASALLFREPAGVAEPRTLVAVFTGQFSGSRYGRTSYPDFLSLKSDPQLFASLAAVDNETSMPVPLRDTIARVRVASVSSDFFSTLGFRPAQGRLFTNDDPRRHPAVIAFRLWQRTFALSESVVGQEITLRGRPYTIVGVAPRGFDGLQLGRPSDIWIPLAVADTSSARAVGRANRRLTVVGRLKSGVTLEQAQRRLDGIARQLAEQYPETNRGTAAGRDDPRSMSVLPHSRLDPALRSRVTLLGVVLFGATSLVLLSACANAGSLLLSRATARGREIAVRFALGATRGRVVRLLLTESLVIAIGAGSIGVLLAVWTMHVLPSQFSPEQAEMLDTRLTPVVFTLTLAIAIAAGAVNGLAPAVQVTRDQTSTALRGDGPGSGDVQRGSRLRAVLVTLQLALSIVMLVVTLLLVRSLGNALRANGAIDINMALLTIETPGGYSNQLRGLLYHRKVLDSVRSLPRVGSAAWSGTLPLARGNTRTVRFEDAAGVLGESVDVDVVVTSPEYFATMNIPMLAGRRFDDRDSAMTKPVAIINDELARRYFAGAAVGRRVEDVVRARDDDQQPLLEIVGIVASAKLRTLQEDPQPTIYYPLEQEYVSNIHLIAKTGEDPKGVVDSIRRVLLQADSDVRISRAATFESYLSEALALDRIMTTLMGACGVIALGLAIIGVYGLMADAVVRRTREIGVRVALGARPRQIVRLVVEQVLELTAAGVVLGLAAAVASMHLLAWLLDGIAPLGATTIATIPIALTLLVVVAALVPAARALRVSPMVALRQE